MRTDTAAAALAVGKAANRGPRLPNPIRPFISTVYHLGARPLPFNRYQALSYARHSFGSPSPHGADTAVGKTDHMQDS